MITEQRHGGYPVVTKQYPPLVIQSPFHQTLGCLTSSIQWNCESKPTHYPHFVKMWARDQMDHLTYYYCAVSRGVQPSPGMLVYQKIRPMIDGLAVLLLFVQSLKSAIYQKIQPPIDRARNKSSWSSSTASKGGWKHRSSSKQNNWRPKGTLISSPHDMGSFFFAQKDLVCTCLNNFMDDLSTALIAQTFEGYNAVEYYCMVNGKIKSW